MAPPTDSKSPQDGPKPGQDGPRSAQDGSETVLKSVFFTLENRLRFCVVWASFWDRFWPPLPPPKASFLAPFWRSKSIKKSIRNRNALKVAPRSPQERPRPSQDAPRTPLESPRTSQEASRTPPDAPRSPHGTPRTIQNVFRSIWANNLFGKIKKFEIVEKMSKKKSTTVIHSGYPHWSHKNRKHFQNGRTQRVAAVVARSALQ